MSLNPHSMLLVEDSQDDELLSLRAVEKCGVPCQVLTLRTGAEAMARLLAEDGPTPELIILDFHLPNYNGLDVLRVIRQQERFRYVPIVMLSSQESDVEFRECLQEGANSCVRKPDEPNQYISDVSLLVQYWLTVHRNLRNYNPENNSDGRFDGKANLTIAIIRDGLDAELEKDESQNDAV